jgi:arylsulfatase A-like enzyme
MKRYVILLTLLPLLCGGVSAAAPKPNIILFFVDDMGYGDAACYGNTTIKTPHMDRLAADGQRWTSFYAAGSTCVPSRTGLMSGRHPSLLGGQPLRDDPQALMPAMFKRAGYATAIIGKWHLAGYPRDFTKDPMHPLECGFDEHFGTPGSNDVPEPPGMRNKRAALDAADKFTFQVPLIRGREVVELPANQELFTRRYTEEAVKYIRARRDRPFFLYLAHNMPHVPVFASPEFQGKSAGGRYGDVIEELDWSVGQVMQAVKDSGLDESTLVVFTSDNGPWSVFGPHGGTAAPLRGEKSTNWEGGQRVPCIFRWPGKIQPGVVNDIGANLDLYATFAALAGGELPSGKPGFMSLDLGGVLLRGENSPRTTWLYESSAFRSGRYKIHIATHQPTDPVTRNRPAVTRHDPPLLFDLETDIAEQTDIAATHPEIVKELTAQMRMLIPKSQSPPAKTKKAKASR